MSDMATTREANVVKQVYIVSVEEIEGAWVAGVYATEAEARSNAAAMSAEMLDTMLEEYRDDDTFGIGSLHWLTASASVDKVVVGEKAVAKYPGGATYIATYRYGLNTSSSEYEAKYRPDGYPREDAV